MGGKRKKVTPDSLLSGLRYSEDEKKQWAKWYVEDGATISEIMRRSGAGRHTVTHWLRELGVKLRGNKRHFDRAAILRDIEAGKLNQSQIARKHKCSARLVSDLATGKLAP